MGMLIRLVLASTLLMSAGCGDKFDPVASSECKSVVRHARELLGDRAGSRSEMMEQCEGSDDQKRGCAMAADSAADLMRCSM